MKTIRGKRALVTGAASGLGRGIALALAREGADLYLLDIDQVGLASVADEATALGVSVLTDRCDLAQPTEITHAVQTMLMKWEHIDILVNNAGIAYYGPTQLMTDSQWSRLMGVNLLAPIQMTRELLPTLRSRPNAHILNVCSISGLVAGGRFAAYHTSKFGLIGFTAALRAVFKVPVEDALEQARPTHARRRFVRAVSTVHAQKTVRQNPAFEKGLELVFDKLRQARAGPGLDLGEEGLEMFPHQAMQDRLLRPPPLVMDRVRRRGAQHGCAFWGPSPAVGSCRCGSAASPARRLRVA